MPVSAPCFFAYHGGVLPFTATARTGSSARSGGRRLGLAAGVAAAVTDAALVVTTAAAVDRRRCECFDLHQQIVPFAESWAWQQSVVTRRKGLVGRDEDHSDTLVALQHPPVYTLGTDSREEYLHFDVEDAPFETHRIDRGGEVTYHGPGQLVMYPILNLRYHKMDLHWYLRSLEEVIIRALQSAFSIKASRIEGLTGVWVDYQFLHGPLYFLSGGSESCSNRNSCSRWIAYHGLALNVTTDLTPFQLIVPCGIKDRGVGSIEQILWHASNRRELNEAALMDIAYKSLITEFAEVFELSLDLKPDLDLQGNNNIN